MWGILQYFKSLSSRSLSSFMMAASVVTSVPASVVTSIVTSVSDPLFEFGHIGPAVAVADLERGTVTWNISPSTN